MKRRPAIQEYRELKRNIFCRALRRIDMWLHKYRYQPMVSIGEYYKKVYGRVYPKPDGKTKYPEKGFSTPELEAWRRLTGGPREEK